MSAALHREPRDVLSISNAVTVVAGSDRLEIKTSVAQLRECGFNQVHGFTSLNEAIWFFYLNSCRLFFIDDTWHRNYHEGMNFIRSAYPDRKQCEFVLLTSDPSIEQFYLGALVGLQDYLVKTPKLHIGVEAVRLLKNQDRFAPYNIRNEPLMNLGFFRSLGLTTREIDILIEFMRDFPRQKELSDRLGKSTQQLRKVFSAIYGKLSGSLAVDNAAQLAHLLTIAKLYRCKGIFRSM